MDQPTELFQGKTNLHLGKKHTIIDIAMAILDVCTKTEADWVILSMKKQMTEKRFLDQEKSLEDLIQKIKKEKKDQGQ